MANDKVVYFHINPLKNEVFYVGIGSKARAYDKYARNKFWKYTTKKYGYIINIVKEGLSEIEAFDLEKFYIKKIGRRDLGNGNLVNMTEGGDGKTGCIETEETKKRKSDYWTNFYKTNISHNLGKTHTKEVNLKKGKVGGKNNTARKIIYKGIEYGCVKSLWKEKFKEIMSYSNFVLLTKKNKINLN